MSSSGHLAILHSFFGLERPTLFFDIVLHVATLFAVLVFFRKDIINLLKKDRNTVLLILLGTIPALIAGLFLGKHIEGAFKNITFISYMLIATGVWLFLGHFFARPGERKLSLKEKPSPLSAILIGVAQAVAILPGISRSGATISSAIMLKLKKEEAFRFSFLLSIPVILAALVYKLKSFSMSNFQGNILFYLIAGFIAFSVGLLALKTLYLFIKKQRLYYFGAYCILLGLVTLFVRF